MRSDYLLALSSHLPKRNVEDAVGVVLSRQHARRINAVLQPRRLVHLRERLHENIVLRGSRCRFRVAFELGFRFRVRVCDAVWRRGLRCCASKTLS